VILSRPSPGLWQKQQPRFLCKRISDYALCRRLFLIFCGVTLFFVGAHAAPTPRRPPRRDFALGVSALYGGWLGRLVWRNSAASSAFYGERGTGIAPRLPHPGEVSPGTPSLLSSASSQLRFAVCKRFEWMRFGVRRAVCGWVVCRPVASLFEASAQSACE